MTEATEEDFLQLVQHLIGTETEFLTELGPMIVAAASLDIASETRSFARKFDVAHALVIRECTHLENELGLLQTHPGGGASGRVKFSLTHKARDLEAVAP